MTGRPPLAIFASVNDGHRPDPILSVIAESLGLTAPTFHEADSRSAGHACLNALKQLNLAGVEWVANRLNDPHGRHLWPVLAGIGATLRRWPFLDHATRMFLVGTLCELGRLQLGVMPHEVYLSAQELLATELRLHRDGYGEVAGMVTAILLRASRTPEGAELVRHAWDRACYVYERTLEAVQSDDLEELVTEVA